MSPHPKQRWRQRRLQQQRRWRRQLQRRRWRRQLQQQRRFIDDKYNDDDDDDDNYTNDGNDDDTYNNDDDDDDNYNNDDDDDDNYNNDDDNDDNYNNHKTITKQKASKTTNKQNTHISDPKKTQMIRYAGNMNNLIMRPTSYIKTWKIIIKNGYHKKIL